MTEGWTYEYEESAKYRVNNYEVTGVRYVLGEVFDTSRKKVLICIGVNPSTAVPERLDQTVLRVQKYAKEYQKDGGYGAWYMLNVYPQRATKPDDMDTEPNMDWHNNNLAAIKELLSTVKEADVWCAWGDLISKRAYLKDLLFGNDKQGTDRIVGIISLFNSNYRFMAYGSTKEGNPRHPLVMSGDDKLMDLADKTVGLTQLNETIDKALNP